MDNSEYTALKDKLIIAGISEIEEHGITDFSLRRVASKCNASCAAPYRHFKNKDEIICEIFKFIDSQWKLLEDEICNTYGDDLSQNLTEICMANILFRAANPSFDAVLNFDEGRFSDERKGKTPLMLEKVKSLSERIIKSNGYSDKESFGLYFKLRSFIYGGETMIKSSEFSNNSDLLSNIREIIEKEIKKYTVKEK